MEKLYSFECQICYSQNYMPQDDYIYIHYIPNLGCRCWNCDEVFWIVQDLEDDEDGFIVDGASVPELEN